MIVLRIYSYNYTYHSHYPFCAFLLVFWPVLGQSERGTYVCIVELQDGPVQRHREGLQVLFKETKTQGGAGREPVGRHTERADRDRAKQRDGSTAQTPTPPLAGPEQRLVCNPCEGVSSTLYSVSFRFRQVSVHEH